MRIVWNIDGGFRTLLESFAMQQTAARMDTLLPPATLALDLPRGENRHSRPQITLRTGSTVARKTRSGQRQSPEWKATKERAGACTNAHSFLHGEQIDAALNSTPYPTIFPNTLLPEQQVSLRGSHGGTSRLVLELARN